jgi:hypothetical protein
MRALISVLILVTATTAIAVPVARSEDAPIQAFYGRYEGRTMFPMGEPRNRDLAVRIRPDGRFGFVVEWNTTIHKAKAKPVNNEQALAFEPTARTNVYLAVAPASGDPPASQTRGARVPGPVDGAPYAWARVAGRTLTVNVFTIEGNGDYVVQTYDRTLTDKGMTLVFMRVRNGQIEQQIKGNLNRIEG